MLRGFCEYADIATELIDTFGTRGLRRLIEVYRDQRNRQSREFDCWHSSRILRYHKYALRSAQPLQIDSLDAITAANIREIDGWKTDRMNGAVDH